MLVLAGLAIILSLLLITAVLLRDRDEPVASRSDAAEQTQPAREESESTAAAKSPDNTNSTATGEAGDVPTNEPASGQVADSEVEDQPSGSPPSVEEDPASSQRASDENADSASSGEERPGQPSLAGDPLLPRNPLLPDSPLQGLDKKSPAEPFAGDQEEDDDVGSMTELPDDLKAMFAGLDDLTRPQVIETEPAPPTIDEFEVNRAAKDEVAPEVAVERRESINMRKALGLTVYFSTSNPEGYPFYDAMLVFAQLSEVPIEVEWVSFELAGIAINGNVQLPPGWLSIEALLEAVCDSVDATFIKADQSLVIKPSAGRFDAAIADLLDLSDVAAPESAIATARRLLNQPQPEAEPSDDDQPTNKLTNDQPTNELADELADVGAPRPAAAVPTEAGQLPVPERLGAQQVAALVCESIRRLRGGKGKLGDAVFARWAGPYSQQVDGWSLLEGGVSGEQSLQPATLVSTVRRLARLNGKTCYVRFPDLAKQGLGPNELVMPKTGEGVSAGQAFDEFLSPANLQVRVVDQTFWWVGSQASYDRIPVVIWFDDGGQQGDGPRAIADRIQAILDNAPDAPNTIGAVAVDEVSGKTIAVLPRFLAHQLPRLLERPE
jgi:hypothetical protein